MRISIPWLQTYFEKALPKTEMLADALTFHVAEVEEVEGDSFEVKVLPDRAAYLLSHRGVAKELSAILNIPLKDDPLREALQPFPRTDELSVTIENPEKCSRYMGALVRGVKVEPSPKWLKEALESVGQRSINNIVDATNYVMLNLGQPLHAFDAKKLENKNGWHIAVRDAKKGEVVMGLDDVKYTLSESDLVIADANADKPIGIAGVKGGKTSGIDEATTDIIVESANFDGTTVRKTAQSLKLWTDASLRFQNRPSPELAAYGMQAVLSLIETIAEGKIAGVVDTYTPGPATMPVHVTVSSINGLLGSSFKEDDIAQTLKRLDLSYMKEGEEFAVMPPFERQDIRIPEDVIEEVGRIEGYEGIPSTLLSKSGTSADQKQFCGIERIKDALVKAGYVEISTGSFGSKGDILLANPLDTAKPYLRADLLENMKQALVQAEHVAPLLQSGRVKLFEMGDVFPKKGETLSLTLGVSGKKAEAVFKETIASLEETLGLASGSMGQKIVGNIANVDLTKIDIERLGESYVPKRVILGEYVPFSIYPFALRDIAVWVPKGTSEDTVASVIEGAAGKLLVRKSLFDVFEKDSDVSYAFHLVFQSPERTLSEEELNSAMNAVGEALEKEKGYRVR